MSLLGMSSDSFHLMIFQVELCHDVCGTIKGERKEELEHRTGIGHPESLNVTQPPGWARLGMTLFTRPEPGLRQICTRMYS